MADLVIVLLFLLLPGESRDVAVRASGSVTRPTQPIIVRGEVRPWSPVRRHLRGGR